MQPRHPGRAGTLRLLAATALATTCGVLPGFLIGAQAVQLSRELDLGAASIGAAVAAGWLTASASSTAMGRLSERLGGSTGLRVAASTSAMAMLFIALVADSWATLAIGAAVGGLANALAQPSANVVIATSLPAHRLGIGFGVKQSAIPMATVLGGVAVPVLTLTVGWVWTFAAGALLALVAAVALPAPVPALVPKVPGEALPPRRTASAERLDPAQRRELRVLGTAVGLGAAAAAALAAFLVAGAVAAGIGEGAAGLLLGGGSLLGVVVRLLLGARADRVSGDQLRVVGILMSLGALALASFSLRLGWVYVLSTPVAFGAGWAWPGLFNLSVVRRFPRSPGAATGVTQTGTYLGAGIGPVVFGAVVDVFGFGPAWLLAAAWLAAAGVVVGVARRS